MRYLHLLLLLCAGFTGYAQCDFSVDFSPASDECAEPRPYRIASQGNDYPLTVELISPTADTIFFELVSPNDIPTVALFPGFHNVTVIGATGCTESFGFSVADDPACLSISGRAWLDENENGIREDFELPLIDVALRLAVQTGPGEEPTFVAGRMTDVNGRYVFGDLAPGQYVVSLADGLPLTVPNSGDDVTTDSDFDPVTRSVTVELLPNQAITDLDAGLVIFDTCGTLDVSLAVATKDECGRVETVELTLADGNFPVTVSASDAEGQDVVYTYDAPTVATLPAYDAYQVTGATGCHAVIDLPADSADYFVTVEPAGDLCAGTASLTAVLNGVLPPDADNLSYQWSDGVTTATNPNPVADGDYRVTVVNNSTGCAYEGRFEGSFDGGQPDSLIIRTVTIPCNADGVTVTASITGEGFVYYWDQTDVPTTNPNFAVNQEGLLTLRTLSPAGCEWTSLIFVEDQSFLDNESFQLFPIFGGNDTACVAQQCYALGTSIDLSADDITVTWTGPTPAVTEQLNGIFTPFLAVCLTVPGPYEVAISNGCDTLTDQIFFAGATACGAVSGTLYLDQGADCGFDPGDTPAPAIVVELTRTATGEVFHTLTDADGNWSIEVPTGDYGVAAVPPNDDLYFNCGSVPVTALEDATVEGVDVFLPAAAACPRVVTDLAMPFLRRCFGSVAWVNYRNEGTVVAENATVTVTLDPFFEDVTASVPPLSQDDNVFVFALGDLAPFTGGTIRFDFTVSCESELGQSHCIEATATPAAPCTDEGLYTGALVVVDALGCEGDSVTFLVTNVGLEPMTVPLNYVIVEDGIMLSPDPFVNGLLAPNEVMPITLEATGGTYHLITNQEPDAPASEAPTAIIEGCAGLGGGAFSTGFTNILPLAAGPLTSSNVCLENVGSYDPNDKRGFPLGFGDRGNEIEPGTRIDYNIRFQNTGTDTAFTVVIRDTLAATLDLATLKLEGASHPYRATLDSQRVLSFIFENILLPDSSVNLAGSQGVVRFSIDHVPELVSGDAILNEAAIYFDFNDPIITNVSRHVITKDGLSVSAGDVANSVPLGVYPNPATDELRVDLPTRDVRPGDRVVLHDLYGRALAQTTYEAAARGWALPQLAPGYYVVVLTDRNGSPRGRAGVVIGAR